jgi:hypothetical protein
MKRVKMFLIILSAIMAGCGGGKQSIDDLIIVDVTKNYPENKPK